MSKYYLTYFEKGKEDFTMEELPETCDSVGKAKARACMMFTKALHTKDIVSHSDGSFAYLHDRFGNVVQALSRRGSHSWAWDNVIFVVK